LSNVQGEQLRFQRDEMTILIKNLRKLQVSQ
jgi:hypothetical protein